MCSFTQAEFLWCSRSKIAFELKLSLNCGEEEGNVEITFFIETAGF
jgi:hypothetical protein